MKISLSGGWKFYSADKKYEAAAELNSTNFNDLLRAGKIPDPFYGENEKDVLWVSDCDWYYKKYFTVSKENLTMREINLLFSYIDTFSEIYINGKLLAKTDNAFLSYRFNIKKYLIEGENELIVKLLSPLAYVKEKQRKYPLPNLSSKVKGYNYARKPAFHFGWDWAPLIPVSGIGNAEIEFLNGNKIEDIYVRQVHENNRVKLKIQVTCAYDTEKENLSLMLFSPCGKELKGDCKKVKSGVFESELIIKNPKLWFPNGVKDNEKKPLYTLKAVLKDEKETNEKTLKLGLCTIKLSTEKDSFGKDFCFIVNNERIFCKGANWIPPEILKRKSYEELEAYIKIMVESNFNMIRVWGGGYIESEEFYDLCDNYGILVWQDFPYACGPYPYFDQNFLNSALEEAAQSVKRIRNHASLALLCGNNEIESMTLAWRAKAKLVKSQRVFFNELLKEKVNSLSPDIPYRCSSPSGDAYLKNVNSDNIGDTHIWGVWHGMMPFEYFLKRNTRFCSEFGFESMPSKEAVLSFTEKIKPLDDSVMLSHQKCPSGNNRMLFYMAKNYRIPKNDEHLIYLSQLTQANSIKVAVEHWRRNLGRCNGSLFWQFNDCWPVSSWSGVDCTLNLKALQYYAKNFYAPLALSATQMGEIFLNNDSALSREVRFSYDLIRFDGEKLITGEKTVKIEKYTTLKLLNILPEKKERDQSVLFLKLMDTKGNIIFEDSRIFTKDRNLKLRKPCFKINCKNQNLIISADTYVRQLMLVKNGVRFEKNFIDLMPNREYIIPFKGDIEKINDLEITSLSDIESKYSRIKEKFKQFKICLEPKNFGGIIYYRII